MERENKKSSDIDYSTFMEAQMKMIVFPSVPLYISKQYFLDNVWLVSTYILWSLSHITMSFKCSRP